MLKKYNANFIDSLSAILLCFVLFVFLQHVPRGIMVQTAVKYVLQVYTALDVNKVVIAPHVIIYMDASRPLKQVGKDKLNIIFRSYHVNDSPFQSSQNAL